jgi:hypothetical protein
MNMGGQFYPRERSSRYPLGGKMGVAQDRHGGYGEEDNFCACRESNRNTVAVQIITIPVLLGAGIHPKHIPTIIFLFVYLTTL